ncbi:hypothetical protein VQ045_03025 [Aurantimonas sp. E1-2-R+4]
MREVLFGRMAVFAASIFTLALGACATGPTNQDQPGAAADSGLDRMERLALAANRCWFKSGDPAFARYSLAPELSSFSGRPRFLLVPRGQLEARPLLVVEAQSGSANVSVYGPLMNEALASRIDTDLARWGAGAKTCSA